MKTIPTFLEGSLTPQEAFLNHESWGEGTFFILLAKKKNKHCQEIGESGETGSMPLVQAGFTGSTISRGYPGADPSSPQEG